MVAGVPDGVRALVADDTFGVAVLSRVAGADVVLAVVAFQGQVTGAVAVDVAAADDQKGVRDGVVGEPGGLRPRQVLPDLAGFLDLPGNSSTGRAYR